MRWAIALALCFLVLAILVPVALMPLNRLWGMIAIRLAVVNNHLVLGLFFYLVGALWIPDAPARQRSDVPGVRSGRGKLLETRGTPDQRGNPFDPF